MRKFEPEGFNRWVYSEKNIIEPTTNKRFTLTQPKTLFSEDYYTVTRCIACENVPVDVVPEESFYLYEINYMPNGYSSKTVFVEENIMGCLLTEFLILFLRGEALNCLKIKFD